MGNLVKLVRRHALVLAKIHRRHYVSVHLLELELEFASYCFYGVFNLERTQIMRLKLFISVVCCNLPIRLRFHIDKNSNVEHPINPFLISHLFHSLLELLI